MSAFAQIRALVRSLTRPLVGRRGDDAVFDPVNLFTKYSAQGVLYTGWKPGSFFTDTAGTTPALEGEAVAHETDWSGNGNHALQATLGFRPLRNGNLLLIDGVDDRMTATIPIPLQPGWTIIQGFDRGSNTTQLDFAKLTASSGVADYITVRSQTSQRVHAAARALSQTLAEVPFGLSANNAMPINTLKLITTIVRDSTGLNEQRINGVAIAGTASNWPAELSLGTSITLTRPSNAAGYIGGRAGPFMAINRVLTLSEILKVEAYFTENSLGE